MKDKLFATRLKTLMARKSLNISELSNLMGCSKPTISSWRSGTIPYSLDIQKKLATILEVEVEVLIYGKESNIYLDAPKETIFSNELNSKEEKLNTQHRKLRKQIESYFNQILDEAEETPFALEHLYIELKIRFPKNIYKTKAKPLTY